MTCTFGFCYYVAVQGQVFEHIIGLNLSNAKVLLYDSSGFIDSATTDSGGVYRTCCAQDQLGPYIKVMKYGYFTKTVINPKVMPYDVQLVGLAPKYTNDSGDDKRGVPEEEASEAEPVNIINGNMYIITTDLSLPSMPLSGFNFTRTYNSLDEPYEIKSGIGMGWTHSFSIRLIAAEHRAFSAAIMDSTGSLVRFIKNASDQYETLEKDYSSLAKNESGFIWEKKNRLRYEFDLEGSLKSIREKNGNTTSLIYDDQGVLTTIKDSLDRSYTFLYDTNGLIIKFTDFSGRAVNYLYDQNGNLIKVTDPEGIVTEYEYNDPNDPHNITKQTIGNKFEYTYVYNENDRCIHASGPNGQLSNSFEYHYDLGYTVISDAKGYTHTKYFNANGKITKIVYADGNEDLFTYDENLNKTSETLRDGSTWQYEYDERGNLTKIIDPLGNQDIMTYDSNDNLLSERDKLGRLTNYSYDESGNITSILYSDGTTINISYNTKGQPITVTDNLGSTITLSYDQNGNLVSASDSEGNVFTYTYDELGRNITETDPMGNTKSYQYDSLNRMIKVTDSLGGQINMSYEHAGLNSLTDQNNNKTSFQYQTFPA